jgi:hypothetical protein
LFCFVLFCFVLFCFVLFCFVCFVCFVLFCFVLLSCVKMLLVPASGWKTNLLLWAIISRAYPDFVNQKHSEESDSDSESESEDVDSSHNHALRQSLRQLANAARCEDARQIPKQLEQTNQALKGFCTESEIEANLCLSLLMKLKEEVRKLMIARIKCSAQDLVSCYDYFEKFCELIAEQAISFARATSSE